MKHCYRFLFLTYILLNFQLWNVNAQEPVFSTLKTNYLYHNPAYFETNDYRSLNTTSRIQWLGLKERAFASMASYIYPVQNTENTIGGMFVYNQVGFSSSRTGSFFYNYNLKIGKRATLALGNTMSITQHVIDFSEYTDPQEESLLIIKTKLAALRPDFGLGAWLNASRFFMGISFQHLLEPVFEYESKVTHQLYRSTYTVIGYRFNADMNTVITPSALIRNVHGKTFMDINTTATYKDKIDAGIGYRTHNSSPLYMTLDYRMARRFHVFSAIDFPKYASLGLSVETGIKLFL